MAYAHQFNGMETHVSLHLVEYGILFFGIALGYMLYKKMNG